MLLGYFEQTQVYNAINFSLVSHGDGSTAGDMAQADSDHDADRLAALPLFATSRRHLLRQADSRATVISPRWAPLCTGLERAAGRPPTASSCLAAGEATQTSNSRPSTVSRPSECVMSRTAPATRSPSVSGGWATRTSPSCRSRTSSTAASGTHSALTDDTDLGQPHDEHAAGELAGFPDLAQQVRRPCPVPLSGSNLTGNST